MTTILGMDPGLATFGFAVLVDGEIIDSGEIGVPPTSKKVRMHFADDFADHIRTLSRRIRKVIRCHHPDIAAFEALSLPRHASAAAKLAAGSAAAISQCVAWNIKIRPVLHSEVDEWLGKSKMGRQTRKAALQKKVLGLWPGHSWPRRLKKKDLIQHPIDAAAVAATAARNP